MRKLLLLVAAGIISISLSSQDVVRVMGYNLLYYGSYTNFCTSENNNHVTKAEYLRTILDEAQPDILVVTELSPEQYYANYILGNVFNIEGINHWNVAVVTNESGSNLTNGLFYDSNLFSLFSQHTIPTSRRDINVYRLRYKNTSELIFLNIVVGHLKAGNTNSDREERSQMIQDVMEYIDGLGHNNNFLMMGDLNVYTSEEPAFQKLINPENPSYSFFDPLDELGNWHMNPNFSYLHTQSTRTDASNSCFVTGGFDARFDFILVDEAILNGSYSIKLKPDSYVTMGQDGERFKYSLIEPENNTLPANIIDALYNMSDHLPVYADFNFGEINSISSHSGIDQNFSARVINPINNDFIFELKTEKSENVNISVYSILGEKVLHKNMRVNRSHQGIIPANSLSDGLYIINFTGENFNKSYRIIKKSE